MLSDILRKKIQMNTSGETSTHQQVTAQNMQRKSFVDPYSQQMRQSSEQLYGQQHQYHQQHPGLMSQATTLKQDPRRQTMEQNCLPNSILTSPPKMANMRISTGGSSKLDTIKAFVEQANRNQMEQLQSQQIDQQSCTIEQAEYTAHGPNFKKPLQDAYNNQININVPANGLYGKTTTNSGATNANRYGEYSGGGVDPQRQQIYNEISGSRNGIVPRLPLQQQDQQYQLHQNGGDNYQTFYDVPQGITQQICHVCGTDNLNTTSCEHCLRNMQQQNESPDRRFKMLKQHQAMRQSASNLHDKSGPPQKGAAGGQQIQNVRLKVNKISVAETGSNRKNQTRQSLNSLDQRTPQGNKRQQQMFQRNPSSSSMQSGGGGARGMARQDSATSSSKGIKTKQQKLFSGKGSSSNLQQAQQPRLFSKQSAGGAGGGSGIPMVRKSQNGLPKNGVGIKNRPGSAAINKHLAPHQLQPFTSYQLDACELIRSRIHKKLREQFDQLKSYVIYTEKAQTYGRYDAGPSDDYYNPYNMQNNTSLMMDQNNTEIQGVRRSCRDLPRQLNDYNRSRESVTNRGEKTDSSIIIDRIDQTTDRSNMAQTYNHQRQRSSVESHQIGLGANNADKQTASPFSSIADDRDAFDRDLNTRLNTMEVKNQNFVNLLQTGNNQLNTLLNDRFEIETIRQEQGFFKNKLEGIKNDIQVMKHLQDHGTGKQQSNYMQTMQSDSHRSTFLSDKAAGMTGNLDEMISVRNIDGSSRGRLTPQMARKIKNQVCNAMQQNYYRRLQNFFSKWQILTKLASEEQYKTQNRGELQQNGGTETKLLLLKSMMRDRILVRQKQAFQIWVNMSKTQKQRKQVNKVMKQMLFMQKLMARKELHQKWTTKAQHKLCFQKWRQQCKAGYF